MPSLGKPTGASPRAEGRPAWSRRRRNRLASRRDFLHERADELVHPARREKVLLQRQAEDVACDGARIFRLAQDPFEVPACPELVSELRLEESRRCGAEGVDEELHVRVVLFAACDEHEAGREEAVGKNIEVVRLARFVERFEDGEDPGPVGEHGAAGMDRQGEKIPVHAAIVEALMRTLVRSLKMHFRYGTHCSLLV
jgi:hypothetical protein